jgi:hypothetical protein
MTTQSPGVLDELDIIVQRLSDMGESDTAYMASKLRTRIAALGDACGPFDRADLFVDDPAHSEVLVQVTVAELRIFAAAIGAMKS